MIYWIKTNQVLVWALARIYLFLTFSVRKVRLHDSRISNQYGYIVASNHQSKLDPFIMFGAMPLRTYLKLTPVRFMAHREFFKVPFYRFFLESWGVFPNKEVAGLEYGLPLSAKILANKGTIVIFPEGTRVVNGSYVEPKRGVAVMASEPDVRLILCHIQWRKGIIPRVSVVVSEPRDCSGQSAQLIMDQIYDLAL
jgi:1-acyl-sn-glycerol-3-phosphate acyltransferase